MTSFGKCMVCLVLNLTTYFYCGVCGQQFTSLFNGNKVTGVLGLSVNFTWAFHGGNVNRVEWGTKRDGAVSFKDVLVSIDKLQTITTIQNPPYSGRVSGDWDGSSPGLATFTLNSIQKADERFYSCGLSPEKLGGQPVYDTVQLLVVDPPTIKEVTSSADKSWIGQTVSLECVSDGVPTPTLTWYKPDGSQISSVTATQNTVNVKMSVDQDFGGYKCDADNGFAPANFKIVKIEQIKKPGSPTIAKLDIQATSLKVKWTAPTDDGGSPITAYRVVILKGDTEIKNENITGPAIILLSVGGLERDTKYTVKVFARNAVFEGPAAEKEVRTKYEGNCEDRLTTPCQPYKDAGYCHTYPDSMTYWCEKTCFICQG